MKSCQNVSDNKESSQKASECAAHYNQTNTKCLRCQDLHCLPDCLAN